MTILLLQAGQKSDKISALPFPAAHLSVFSQDAQRILMRFSRHKSGFDHRNDHRQKNLCFFPCHDGMVKNRISGCSSIGRARHLGCRGWVFKSPHSDQNPSEIIDFRGIFLIFDYCGAEFELLFLTYLFYSSCAKCEMIIRVIRLFSVFSHMRIPSSRLSNLTFRTESADQICRQACLIII